MILIVSSHSMAKKKARRWLKLTVFLMKTRAVEWGKVSLALDGVSELPLEVRYYDEDLALARTITYSEVRDVDGRPMPTKMVVVPTDKPEESTTVLYDQITFNVELEDSYFSLRRLKDS